MRAVRRYEDGDAEHLQWAELKQILLSLPARDDAQALTTPAVVPKSKRTATKTGKLSASADARFNFDNRFGADTCGGFFAGTAGADSAKKQKVSPAGGASAKKQKVSPPGADSAKKQKVLPASANAARKKKVSPAGPDSTKKQKAVPAGTDSTQKPEVSPADTTHEISPEGAFTYTLLLCATLHAVVVTSSRVYCRQDSGMDRQALNHRHQTPTQQASKVSESLVG